MNNCQSLCDPLAPLGGCDLQFKKLCSTATILFFRLKIQIDQRETSGSVSRSPGTPDSSNTLNMGTQEFLDDDDNERKKMTGQSTPWEYSSQKTYEISYLINYVNCPNRNFQI